MKLSELKTGESGVITRVYGHGGFRKRIIEMGFINGQSVEVILNAPLKDPVKYKIMDYEVSLRRAEAELIEIVSEEEAASEETSETTEETITEEDSGFFDKLSHGAKDFLIVAKEILNQPIVIGGVSVSLGAIVIFVVGKLFSALGKKKVNELANRVDELFGKMTESVNKKDYNELAKQTEELVEICKVLANGTRNVKVKEQALALLEDFKPVIEDNKEFAIEETKKVVEDSKVQLDKTAQDIVGIVNKD